jgi:hypothetical protein
MIILTMNTGSLKINIDIPRYINKIQQYSYVDLNVV